MTPDECMSFLDMPFVFIHHTYWINGFFSSRAPYRSPSFSMMILKSMIRLSGASWVSALTLTNTHCDYCSSVPPSPSHLSVPPDLMQFMGDVPMKKKATQSDCVRHILLVSALSTALRVRVAYSALCVCFHVSLSLMGVQEEYLCFSSVREGKGAAERWDLLPGHQANHQQSKQVSVCHLFLLNTCYYSIHLNPLKSIRCTY